MRITKENLTRYDQHFKSWHRRRLGYGKALENWHQTEEAGAVAFYPVGGSPLEGKVKFSFKEVLPAEGDKSPSNPSTISGKNSVIVSHIGGKNFLSYNFASCSVKSGYTSEYYGIKCVHNEGVYTLSGTATQLRNIYITHITEEPNILKLPPGTYTLSVGLALPSGIAFHVQVTPEGGVASAKIYTGGNVTFSMDKQFKVNAYLRNASGASYPEGGLVCRPQLEFGSVATDFEPSTVQNYTLPLGNTYYGGEIDLATGLMTVTWYGEYVSTITNTELASNYVRATLAVTYGHMGSGSAPAYFRSNYDDDGTYVYPRYSAGTARISISFPYEMLGLDPSTATVETTRTAVESFLAQHPCFVVYRLYTPQTVQLSPLTLAALAQTSRHEPRLNTVYTDADSIQITYQKSPIRAATEQEMAILGLGGNV